MLSVELIKVGLFTCHSVSFFVVETFDCSHIANRIRRLSRRRMLSSSSLFTGDESKNKTFKCRMYVMGHNRGGDGIYESPLERMKLIEIINMNFC